MHVASWLLLLGVVEASARWRDAMADASNDLGLALLQDFVSAPGNVALSPLAAAATLVALWEGARGDTALQLRRALELPEDKDQVRAGFRDLHRLLRGRHSEHQLCLSDLFLLSADAVPLEPAYVDVLRFYGYQLANGTSTLAPDTGQTLVPPATLLPLQVASTSIPEGVLPPSAGTGAPTTLVPETTEAPAASPSSVPGAATTPVDASSTLAPDTEETPVPPQVSTLVPSTSGPEGALPPSGTTMEAPAAPGVTTLPVDVPSAASPETTEAPAVPGATTIPLDVPSTLAPETAAVASTMPVDVPSSPDPGGMTAPVDVLSTPPPEATEATAAPEPMTTPESLPSSPAPETAPGPITAPVDVPSTPAPETAPGPITAPVDVPSTPAPVTAPGPMTTPVDLPSSPVPGPMTTPESLPSSLVPETAPGPITAPVDVPSTPAPETAPGPMTTPVDLPSSPAPETAAGAMTAPVVVPSSPSPETAAGATTPGLSIASEVPESSDTEAPRSRRAILGPSSRRLQSLEVAPFLVRGALRRLVPALRTSGRLPFARIDALRACVLQIPIQDASYRVLLVLPETPEDLPTTVAALRRFPLSQVVRRLRTTAVSVAVPLFSLHGVVLLTSTLQHLGVWDVFDPQRADLSCMSVATPLYVVNVAQRVDLELRPRPLEARGGFDVEDAFVADRAFLFFVLDGVADVALLAGKVEDPLSQDIT